MTTTRRAFQVAATTMASPPVSINEAARTVELIIATEAPAQGEILSCQPGAVTWADAPVPVLLDHTNKTTNMAGRITSVRFSNGQLIGTAQFTDAPAADIGWQLAKAGCGVSVGASFMPADVTAQGLTDRVNRWRLLEVSLTPVPVDTATTTRSIQTNPEDLMTDTTAQTTAPDVLAGIDAADELSPAEARRQLKVTRSANLAGLSTQETDDIIQSTKTTEEGVMQVLRSYAARTERVAASAGHPARVAVNNAPGVDSIEGQFQAAIEGKKLEQPLWLSLRSAGIGRGNSATDVWRSALSGETRSRSLSTSDLPQLLTATGDRQLLTRFQVADAGIRLAANVRQLKDYRSASVLDVGLVGSASRIYEGGEIQFSAVSEAAASYSPQRYGLGLTLTPEALANDDLASFDAALAELAAALLDKEALALVALLEGSALGSNAPDGKSLFHADHANKVATGPVGLTSLSAAVALLRKQVAIGGRFVAQEPTALIVSPDHEAAARQLLTDITPAQQSNVNPWVGLTVSVEPRLNGSYAYLLGSGGRAPLELGRYTSAPTLLSELEFSTGNFRAKAEHAFGTIVQEHRSIIRIATAA